MERMMLHVLIIGLVWFYGIVDYKYSYILQYKEKMNDKNNKTIPYFWVNHYNYPQRRQEWIQQRKQMEKERYEELKQELEKIEIEIKDEMFEEDVVE